MDRKRDGECRAGPRAATARGDVPVVCLDEGFGDCQADTGPTVFAVARRVRPVEALEYVWQVLGGDSVAVVGHRDRDIAVVGTGGDIDPPAGGSVAQRIVEQVAQDLPEPVRIRPQRGQIAVDVRCERPHL